MATYYVWSGATGTNDGSSWTNAFNANPGALTAAYAAATTNGDVIKIHKTHIDQLAVNTSFSALAHITVLVVDKDNSDALATMDGSTGYVGHLTASRNVGFSGAFVTYLHGMYAVTGGATAVDFNIGTADNATLIANDCTFHMGSTSSVCNVNIGSGSTTGNNYVEFKNVSFRYGNTSQRTYTYGRVVIDGGAVLSSGSRPAILFHGTGTSTRPDLECRNFDMSYITGTIITTDGSSEITARFYNCKLGAGAAKHVQSATIGMGALECFYYNCATGDEHYEFEHYNNNGQTVVSTGIYANDGATYDGTNRCSWKITTSAYATFWNPYKSPWFYKYNAGGSAITPSIEILRDDSTTAYTDAQVWGEWSYSANASDVMQATVDDHQSIAAYANGTSASNQAAGAGLGNWTGESGTAWSGKLAPASSFTPQNIGHIGARICVGLAETTLYADPTMRD
jgi:hypothetical protein